MKPSQDVIRSESADKITIPKNEVRWVTYSNETGEPRFIITSKPMRDMYFLYEVQNDGSLKKLGKSTSPSELEDDYEVRERCKGA